MANIFLKMDTLEGESVETDYKGWIEVESTNFAVNSPSSVFSGTGSGVGKPEPSPVTLVVRQGKHCIEILKRQFNGKHWANVQIVGLKQTGDDVAQKYYEIKLKEAFIMNYNPDLSGNGHGMEQLTFTYSDVEVEYFAQNTDGILTSVGKSGYNVKEGKAR